MSALMDATAAIYQGAVAAGTWLWTNLGPFGTLIVAAVGVTGLVMAVWPSDVE